MEFNLTSFLGTAKTALTKPDVPIDYMANIASSFEWANVWLFWIVVILALGDFGGGKK